MRFPTADGKIDPEKTMEMLEYALKAGVNYYDTALPYHDGESESFLGKNFLSKHRDEVKIATKMPVWEVNAPEDFDRIFNTQLEKLGVDYIDFYLFHALDRERWPKVKSLGLYEKAKALKAEGKIKHLGFSFHDDLDIFKQIIDEGEEFEFCQIQFNYINITHQAGEEGLYYAAEKGLDVIIMEPLLGGRLANPTERVANALDSSKSPVEWALDFLWDYPQIKVILSGMSTLLQTQQNIEYASSAEAGVLNAEQKEMFKNAKEIFDNTAAVGCTACAYCMPCPAGINIPEVFRLYNVQAARGKRSAQDGYNALEVKPDACLECGACMEQCPQAINIPKTLKDAMAAISD